MRSVRVVAKISDLNQQTYELFARPLIQAIANDVTAKGMPDPSSVARSAMGALNLNLGWPWLGPAAAMVKSNRRG